MYRVRSNPRSMRGLLGLTVLATVVCASQARASTRFNWTDPSVSVNVFSPFSVTITGNTQGDRVIPFTVTITSVGSPLNASISLLGNDPNALNLELPATRVAGTLMTVDIRLNNGWTLSNSSYTLYDIDASPGNGVYTDWRDRLTVLNGGSTLTAVNPSFVQIAGLVATGFQGNAANNSTNGNVRVSTPGTFLSLNMTYGPAPGDGLGSNQRFGLSEIVVNQIVTPEPGAWVLMGTGLFLCLAGALRKRDTTSRRRSASPTPPGSLRSTTR
jgi:hypothetical protein